MRIFASGRERQLHERLLEIGLLRPGEQLVDRAVGDAAPLRHHDDVVAQPFDLLA